MHPSHRPGPHLLGRPSRRLAMFACAALLVLGLPTIAAPSALASPAAGGPGALSHFDLARKDCLGTSRTTSSKVWFTVAGGVLSDVYYPTIDNTNVETLQYIVTDGSTFTDLQTRDMVSTASALDASGMSCRVTSDGEPVASTRSSPTTSPIPIATRCSCAHVSMTITRISSSTCGSIRPSTATAAAERVTAVPIRPSPTRRLSIQFQLRTTPTHRPTRRTATMPSRSSPRSTAPSPQVTNGYAGGASDGLTQLDTSHHLTTVNESAANGNIVQVAEVKRTGQGAVTFALGFGATQAAAVNTAEQSLLQDFGDIRDNYEKGWARYDKKLNPPPKSLPGISAARVSELGRRVLPQHQRREGRRGQDVPRRDRCRVVVTVGPGRVGR